MQIEYEEAGEAEAEESYYDEEDESGDQPVEELAVNGRNLEEVEVELEETEDKATIQKDDECFKKEEEAKEE